MLSPTPLGQTGGDSTRVWIERATRRRSGEEESDKGHDRHKDHKTNESRSHATPHRYRYYRPQYPVATVCNMECVCADRAVAITCTYTLCPDNSIIVRFLAFMHQQCDHPAFAACVWWLLGCPFPPVHHPPSLSSPWYMQRTYWDPTAGIPSRCPPSDASHAHHYTRPRHARSACGWSSFS